MSVDRLAAVMETAVPHDYSLYNDDLAPVPAESRTWGVYNYASLWIGMSVCIPTYMLASGLIAGGMNWRQAIGTILLGNLIVLVPMLLNAHAGAKYGIPFPVVVRASFGVRGANVPAMLRALVACGWFGIQTWIAARPFTPCSGSRGIRPLGCGSASSDSGPPISSRLEGSGDYQVGGGSLGSVHDRDGRSSFVVDDPSGGRGSVLSAPSKFRTTGEF